jgi:hypothetical protein
VSDYRLDDLGSIPSRSRGFFFAIASVSRPALRTTQPPIPVQWVLGVLSGKVKPGRGVTLITHPHLVPRSRMSRSYISCPHLRLLGGSRTDFLLMLQSMSTLNVHYQQFPALIFSPIRKRSVTHTIIAILVIL